MHRITEKRALFSANVHADKLRWITCRNQSVNQSRNQSNKFKKLRGVTNCDGSSLVFMIWIYIYIYAG